MLKRKLRVLLIAFLIVALIIPTYLSSVSSSTGSIRINSISTSTPGQQVQAGGNVNLYFAGVTWDSDSLYLFLSQDGLTQISSGDFVYTPRFSVYDVVDTNVPRTYIGENGAWITGSNWINGSIPTTLAVGNYYIKAFDQVTSTVAVTDTSIIVNSIAYNATLNISPSAGPGGVNVVFTGSKYPAGSNVAISYYDPSFRTWNYLTSVTANASGQILTNSEVPDLKKSLGSADYTETFNTISYRAEINGIAYSYANYNEYLRGLKTIGNQTANGLYGNGTNLISRVRAMVGDTIAISGKWFHPGVVYIRWDSVNVVGTVTSDEWRNAAIIGSDVANSNGSFSTAVTIPNATAGEHYIAVEDSQTRITVKIFISKASLNLSPSSGPGGANVQFTGSGYPDSTEITVSCLDPVFRTWGYWTSTTSDSSGKLDLTVEIPDLKKSSRSGEMGNSSTLMSFRTEVNGIPYSYVDFNQYWRGLKQVGNQVAYGLFGNGTSFTSTVKVNPGDSLLISGKWFHLGVVYVRFDGVAVVGTVTEGEWRNAQIIGTTTASSTGSFSTTVTIPTASGGEHYLAVEDSQTKIITKITVLGAVIPTPTPTSNPTPTPKPTPNPSLPTPTIDASCKGTSITNGFKVNINGNLLLNGNPLAGTSILISYSVTGGDSWQGLTLVKTRSDGSFAAVWTPDVTGNYLIKAAVEATSTFNGASKTVNLALTPDEERNIFTLNSNSTISQFAFNSTTQELSFTASGPSGSTGYVEMYIPKTLITDISTLKAYVDGTQISFHSESQSDAWLITFNYSHSEHRVTMELGNADLQPIETSTPPWISDVILLAIIAIVIVVIAAMVVAFKRTNKNTAKNSKKANTPNASFFVVG